MSNASAIETATKRLSLALDALDAAVERRRELDREGGDMAEQMHQLGVDRSRLASDLDATAARSRQIEATNREVARRLDLAMDTIRTVIEAHDR